MEISLSIRYLSGAFTGVRCAVFYCKFRVPFVLEAPRADSHMECTVK
jgi:hypothetical protein